MGAIDGVGHPGATQGSSSQHTPAQVQQQQQQPGNYPQLRQPAGAVVAPGGYNVYNPATPPAELPTPFIDVQKPRGCCHSSKQQQQQPYAPVKQFDHSAVAIGQPVQHPGGTPHQGKKDCCQCSLGWVLYGLGWILPICWVASIVLPFITKDRGDKRAAIASAVTLVALVAAVVITVVVLVATTSRG